MAGLLVSIIVLAVMPRGRHASNADVWRVYSNETGGWSDGICFLMGLLNAAFAVGVPDCISHLAEEGAPIRPLPSLWPFADLSRSAQTRDQSTPRHNAPNAYRVPWRLHLSDRPLLLYQ